MKRGALLCGLMCVTTGAAALHAQTREAYQQAYRDWRQDDPNLERDAAKAGSQITPRTDKAAAGVAKYLTARKAFYDAQRSDLAAKSDTLQPFELPKESAGAATAESLLAAQETSDTNSIQVFGGDPDKGIQQLGQAIERERAAIDALRSAVKTREMAWQSAAQANEPVERARKAAADQIKAISASFEQSSQETAQLGEAWQSYYRAVSSGARGIGAPDAAPAPAIRPPDSTPSSTPAATALSTRAPAGVPISRYTGSWTFLPGVSTYHGLPPMSFDVFVREENGQLVGTVNARFIVAGAADPNVRFDFVGPLQAGRYQAFPLQTPEGAKGKVELIPGNAFNLLEVNYTFEGGPPKVRDSDVILVKR